MKRPSPRASLRPRIVLREIARADDALLPGAYEVLVGAFSRSERVSLAEWRATLRESEGGLWTDLAWHLVVATRGGHVVGLATGTYFGSLNVGMVGYLASTADARGAGLGTRLRAHLRRRFERDARRIRGLPLQAVVGEVSAENPWLRRLARRPEVLVLDVPYFQPGLYQGDDPSPFHLYYETVNGPPRPSLPVAEVRRLVYAIWRRGYRIARPLERPAFRRMLRALEGRRLVGRVTLDTPSSP